MPRHLTYLLGTHPCVSETFIQREIDALRRCVRYSANVGAVVVVTDPKDEKARAFYASHGFAPLDERRMFMPMSALIEREKRGWDA